MQVTQGAFAAYVKHGSKSHRHIEPVVGYLCCQRTWLRLQSEADGGREFSTFLDAGLPRDWLDATPLCWDELWVARGRR